MGYETYLTIFKSIDELKEKDRIIPCLILLYSLIDGFSWLADNSNSTVKKRFTIWVDKYLIKSNNLQCSALELYGARCGLMHNQTADSNLSKQKEIKKIYYAFGNLKSEDLINQLKIADLHNDCVTVQFEDLYESVKKGIMSFLNDVNNDKKLNEQFEEKMKKVFTIYIP